MCFGRNGHPQAFLNPSHSHACHRIEMKIKIKAKQWYQNGAVSYSKMTERPGNREKNNIKTSLVAKKLWRCEMDSDGLE